MRCMEEYLFDRSKLAARPLGKVLAEDYCFDLEREEASGFRVSKGFLWCGECRAMEVDEKTVYLHGSKLFMVSDSLKVYELPSALPSSGLVVRGDDCVYIEKNGRRWTFPDMPEDEVLDGTFLGDRVWIWHAVNTEGRRHLSRSTYLLETEKAVRCEGKMYARDGETILQVQDILVRKDAEICNPTRVWSRGAGDGMVVITTTPDTVWMEYGGYVSSKPCCKEIYGMDGCRLLGLSSCVDVSDLYLTLRLFTDIPVEVEAVEKIEEYLFKLFVFTDRGGRLVEWLVESGMDRQKEMILCRLYRKVDDKGKRVLERWMQGIQSLDALKLIIIYFPEKLERYIKMCIEEKREFEIEEVVEHYQGSDKIEEICLVLLKNSCLHLFSLCMPEYKGRFGDVALVERYNMESQRNMWKTQRIHGDLI
ncbi:hypothetical protein [Encephalitozoon cuniculi GB-M1]|uniref:Uncharacterized protein ECU07_1120 n=1 Tax=Encephalitozoon cuniculi (strain GB-M1) TaxID=284813 RepID=Y7B2_ENCCU|nr:uncharacterized protein ECU07_1120 [Encephalitozoon cuniculi GB-M1]Q8SUY5.1 RecName: Full=Uncharacterized protein ECU07_1120 [Encephalitozoon cuniculi GB-M1]CAD25645.1 hypothetical protein [Encephalitozoon cuniculi GB-M1]